MSILNIFKNNSCDFEKRVELALNCSFISQYLNSLEVYFNLLQRKEKGIEGLPKTLDTLLNGRHFTFDIDINFMNYLEELSELYKKLKHIKAILKLRNGSYEYVLNEISDVIYIIEEIDMSLNNLVYITNDSIQDAVKTLNTLLNEILVEYNKLNTENICLELKISQQLQIQKKEIRESLNVLYREKTNLNKK